MGVSPGRAAQPWYVLGQPDFVVMPNLRVHSTNSLETLTAQLGTVTYLGHYSYRVLLCTVLAPEFGV